MSDGPRYILHPGDVPSRHDGDWHYISVAALRELYAVPPHANVIVIENGGITSRAHGFREEPGDIHCWPRWDGSYPLFVK